MIDFIKTILLVAVFYALILFSFINFNSNKEAADFRETPYVQEFFQIIKIGASYLDVFLIEKVDFLNNKKTKNSDIENLLPNNLNDLDNFFKE